MKGIGRFIHLCVTDEFVSNRLIVYFQAMEKAKQDVADKYMSWVNQSILPILISVPEITKTEARTLALTKSKDRPSGLSVAVQIA